MPYQIKAVFWGIDGVIVNSEPLHEAKIIETAHDKATLLSVMRNILR